MRTISGSGLAALAAGRIAEVYLVEMQLNSGTLRLCSTNRDISWGGENWTGMESIGSMGTITDAAGELAPLQFTMLAADPTIVAIALGESTQGRPVIVRDMLLDPDSHEIIDVQIVWSGTLEPMGYEEQYGEDGFVVPIVTVQAEHRGVSMQRPRALRYTDSDQQRLYPGDLSHEYIVAQAGHQDVWPAADYWRQ